MRTELANELQLDGVRPLPVFDPDRSALAERLKESSSPESDALHVLAMVKAEARDKRSVQFVQGCAFEEKSWRRKLAMTPTDAATSSSDRKPGASIGPAAPRSDHPDGTFVNFGDAT